jgi:hypothetical protein
MNKLNLLILVNFLLLQINANAETNKYITLGTNLSTLRSQGGKSEWGKFIGFGLKYSKQTSLFLAFEGAYATKKFTLENISWQSDSELYNSGKNIGDITSYGSFFELTTKVGYHLPKIHKQVSIELFLGPTISFHYRYTGKAKVHEHLWYDDEKGPHEFYYIHCENEGLVPNISIDGTVGAFISYKAFGIEIRYARSSEERTCIGGLTINGKWDSFYILLQYCFKK